MENYGIPALVCLQEKALASVRKINKDYPHSLPREETGAPSLEDYIARVREGFLYRDQESAKRAVPVIEALCETGDPLLIGLLTDEIFRFTHGTPQRWYLTGGAALKEYRNYRDNLMRGGAVPIFSAKPESFHTKNLTLELTKEKDYEEVLHLLLARQEVAEEILMNFSADVETDSATFAAVATNPHPSSPSFFYKVKKSDDGEMVGLVGIYKGEPRAAGKLMVGELIFLFSPQAWIDGQAKEACALLVEEALAGKLHGETATSHYFAKDFAFPYDLIVCRPSAYNVKGASLLSALGFEKEGIKRKAYYSEKQGFLDAACFCKGK